jgi:hypothetical protein
MEDEKSRVKHYGTIGVVLIFFGIALFIVNYERQTLQVDGVVPGQEIINYYAPLWDPLPHHVKITAESSEHVTFKVAIEDNEIRTETFTLEADKKTIDVYPGETIWINIENTGSSSGTVRTVLWCDSWNYAAAILSLLGLVLLRV